MIEWTTGCDYLPLYHIDGDLNLSELLTKKHDLTIEDLPTGSNLQLGTEDMPLFPYQSLTLTREVEELIEEECFKDVSPPPEPLIPDMEVPGLGAGIHTSVLHSAIPPSVHQRRVGWELIS